MVKKWPGPGSSAVLSHRLGFFVWLLTGIQSWDRCLKALQLEAVSQLHSFQTDSWFFLEGLSQWCTSMAFPSLTKLSRNNTTGFAGLENGLTPRDAGTFSRLQGCRSVWLSDSVWEEVSTNPSPQLEKIPRSSWHTEWKYISSIEDQVWADANAGQVSFSSYYSFLPEWNPSTTVDILVQGKEHWPGDPESCIQIPPLITCNLLGHETWSLHSSSVQLGGWALLTFQCDDSGSPGKSEISYWVGRKWWPHTTYCGKHFIIISFNSHSNFMS